MFIVDQLAITKQLVYGSSNPTGDPNNFIRNDQIQDHEVYPINMKYYLATGAGRYADAADSKLVQSFFQNSRIFEDGEYDAQEVFDVLSNQGLIDAPNLNSAVRFNILNYFTDPSSNDYLERVYVFGGSWFQVRFPDDAKPFVVSNGIPKILQNQMEIFAEDDDFDFRSETDLANLANEILIPSFDPYGLIPIENPNGDTLEVIIQYSHSYTDFGDGRVYDSDYTDSSYNNEVRINALNYTADSLLISGSKQLLGGLVGLGLETGYLGRIESDNRFSYFSSDGKKQIYGTNEADNLNTDSAETGSSTTALSAFEFVGGAGGDLIVGGLGQDRLWGGSGNDTLTGGAGRANDQFIGGAGNDRIIGSDGESDIALFYGDCIDYAIIKNENGTFQVRDERPLSPEGARNILKDVEYVGFGLKVNQDGTISRQGELIKLSDIEGEGEPYRCEAHFKYDDTVYFGELRSGYGEASYSLERMGDTSFDVPINFDGEFTFGNGEFIDFEVISTTNSPEIDYGIYVDFPEDTDRVEVELIASLSEGHEELENRTVFGEDKEVSTSATFVFTDNDPDDDNRVFGDPHLITNDGLAYDFQAGGDYVLTRATEGDPLEVHVRFRSEDELASYVEAIGTEVDGHKVSFDYANPEEGGVLRVNGEEVFLSDLGIPVKVGEGEVIRKGDEIVVEYSNGESLTIVVGDSFLGVGIDPFPTRADGSFEGLLGNGDGDATNDLALDDGTILSQPVSADDLYGTFADSWKVDPANSLLDGEPAPYTTPDAIVSIDDFPDDIIAEATALVDEAGITDPQLREWAIYDYAVTQNPAYIEEAKELEADFTAPVETLEVEGGNPTIFLTADQVEVFEGSDGTQTLSFMVSRSDTENPLEVSYVVSGVGESPADGEDFGGELPSGTVQFEAGEATATIEIGISGDTEFESDEDFELALSLSGTSADEYVLALGTQEATIRNDDFRDPDLTLEGTDDADTLIGGSGDDRISGKHGKDHIEGGDGDDKIWGNHGSDTLLGGAGDDRIGDWTGWSTLDGGEGNDSLFAGAGRDTLIGGEGDDLMEGGKHADTFVTGLNHDTIKDFKIAEDQLEIAGYDFGYGEGQILPEEFLSDHGSFDGADLLITLSEGDTIRLKDMIDPDNPPASVASMADVLLSGEDKMGTEASETLTGSHRGDEIDGAGGDDLITGEGASDLLRGGEGHDTIIGGGGADQISGGEGKDFISGGEGNDYLHGNHGKDTILGGAGDDFLGDWAGWSHLDGGEGDDKLKGGAGEDTLIGGEGDDTITGGKHADTFVSDVGSGHDTYTDFEYGEDKADLLDVDFGDEEGQVSRAEYLREHGMFEENGDLFLSLSDGRSIKMVDLQDDEIGEDPEDYEEIFLI